MTMASRIGLGQARSVGTPVSKSDVVLGDDWVKDEAIVELEERANRERRGFLAMNRSPLARKIITFNLIAILILVAGVMYLNPFRDSLVYQRQLGLVHEAELVADVFEVALSTGSATRLAEGLTAATPDLSVVLEGLSVSRQTEVHVHDGTGARVAGTEGLDRQPIGEIPGLERGERSTTITAFLNRVWDVLAKVFGGNALDVSPEVAEQQLQDLIQRVLTGQTEIATATIHSGDSVFVAASPIIKDGQVVGAVSLSSAAGEIDELVRAEREQVLQMFVIAIVVSIGLSLVLASTIANPLSDLAAAAEIGRDRNSKSVKSSRVRIPDLSAAPTRSAACPPRCAAWWRPCMTGSTRTSSSPQTWRTKSRTRWPRCGRPSALCASCGRKSSARNCWT